MQIPKAGPESRALVSELATDLPQLKTGQECRPKRVGTALLAFTLLIDQAACKRQISSKLRPLPQVSAALWL